ncbi:uncharacterized protein EAF02_003233 [Botrytis sinoallii]|uniref:uncharacterized protein n=1 Tax=Botrytis sinoallii TaxID=1463999 RepID=UPI0018FFF2C3|nr:uncharacterized protein EAF02_003233 [Botrytis sinoallii]KAF7888692.1 hypothetical protein EAF02_003233 [Botrytis sinoallii]
MSSSPSHFTSNETTQQPATSTTYQTSADFTRQEKPYHSKSTKKIQFSNIRSRVDVRLKSVSRG